MPIQTRDAEGFARSFPAQSIASAIGLTGQDAVDAATRLDQLFTTLSAQARSSGAVEPYVWALVVTYLQEAIASHR